ncbi:MAG: hypothetical protein AAF622_12455 [Cyanobacteria bacterium P01_C01_bin.147]
MPGNRERSCLSSLNEIGAKQGHILPAPGDRGTSPGGHNLSADRRGAWGS